MMTDRQTELNPLMNNTKWDELRLAMYSLEPPPQWSTHSLTGYTSPTQREWYCHFRDGGYDDIVYVDIMADTAVHMEGIAMALREIHVPADKIEGGFRVYGYSIPGQFVSYL
jgi:hypothetical protein